jgi:hypothetical protein
VLIDPEKVALLKEIVEKTSARIVLSSSWSKYWDKDPIDSAGKRINVALAEYGLEISTKIPQIRGATRSQEIEVFLKKNPCVVNFVILDDNDHGWSRCLRSHWVQTDSTTGLNEETVSLAVSVLQGDLLSLPKETLWQRIKTACHKFKRDKL